MDISFSDVKNAYRWGVKKNQVICPHCQKKGDVFYKKTDRKKGISGGKATAAILTLGWSMLATGLSRKENHIQAHCINCNTTWDI